MTRPWRQSTWDSSNQKHGTSKVVEYVGTAKMIDTCLQQQKMCLHYILHNKKRREEKLTIILFELSNICVILDAKG